MKTLIPLVAIAGLALSVAVHAEDASKATAPDTTSKKDIVVSTYRIMPKPGHANDLKAALAAHAAKYHKGEQAWRVGEVQSGPDSGMYQIVEGPSTWTALDDRGDLGAEHMKDYETNILPHIEKATPDQFAVYQQSLSTVPATKWSNKVLMLHLVVKPGRGLDAHDVLKKWKAIYEKRGFNVAVWQSAWSGDSTITVVFRLPHGLKDLDEDMPPMRKTSDELFGPNEYNRLQEASTEDYSRIWSEMIEYKPDLGSK